VRGWRVMANLRARYTPAPRAAPARPAATRPTPVPPPARPRRG
jgi:hypothetical protein